MPNLVTVEAAAELLNTTKASLMTTACVHKKNTGRYPKFYLSTGKRGGSKSYIDMDVLDNNRQITRSIWMYLTDYIYWYIIEDLKISENELATKLSVMSDKYPNHNSWVSFLRTTLFTLPPENVYSISVSMTTEFFRHSIAIIKRASHLKFDWEEHSKKTQWVNIDRTSSKSIMTEEMKAVLTYC